MGISEKEKKLIKKTKNGDIEAFEQLIEEYQKSIYNISFRMLGNFEDASDMSQEVFLRIYRSIDKFREESSFLTWVYRITKNVCLDELRKRKNKNIVSLDEEIELMNGKVARQIESTEDTPDILAERSEMKEYINEAILSLSDEHRMVIVLRDVQGFSYEEIANIVDCPEGTVKSRINRARKALKEVLKSKGELFPQEFVK